MDSEYIRTKMRAHANKSQVDTEHKGLISYKQAKSAVRDEVSRLIEECSKKKSYTSKDYDYYVREAIDNYIQSSPKVDGFISENGSVEIERLKSALVADFIMHGKLQPALDSNEISEIQINDYNSIWVEKNGEREPYIDSTTGKRIMLPDREEYEHFVGGLLLEDNKKLTASSSIIDAITKDGYRVSVQGSGATVSDKDSENNYKPICVTIRKQREQKFTSKELVESKCMGNNMSKLLELIPVGKLTSFIGGPTGSGKTVILQVLADNCPDDMRIAALGNPAELSLRRRFKSGEYEGVIQNNVVHLEAKEWHSTDKAPKEFPTIENCARTNLRLTPDVVIYEEIRSKEEFEFTADAAQTGHFFLTSLHADSVEGLLSRYITQYIAATQGIDRNTAVDIIASFLRLVIIRKKMPDHTRKITEICEITGAKYDEGGNRVFDVNPLFSFIRDKEVLGKNSMGQISRKSLSREVKGNHYRVGTISDKLKNTLLDAGFDEESISFLSKPLEVVDGKVVPEVDNYIYNPLFLD